MVPGLKMTFGVFRAMRLHVIRIVHIWAGPANPSIYRPCPFVVHYTLYTVSVSFGNLFSSFGTSHMARHALQMPITAPPSTSVG